MTAPSVTHTVPDLVAHLPQMFGYHPGESVILVALTAGGNLALCARHDREALVPLQPGALAESLGAMRARDAAYVVVVSYHSGESAENLQPLTSALTEAGMSLMDVGHVDAGEWVSLRTGTRADLTPPEGVPAYSRDALAMSLQPMGSEALAAALDGAQAPSEGPQVAAALEAWSGLLTGAIEPSDAALLTALPLLRSVAHRDALVATVVGDPALTPFQIVDADTAERMTRTLPAASDEIVCAALSSICHATPPAHAPNVLALAGICHLAVGHGTHASLLTEHAQRIDPEHTLSRLVAQMAAHAVSPI